MGSALFEIDPFDLLFGLLNGKFNPTQDPDIEEMREYWRDVVGLIPQLFWDGHNRDGIDYITDPAQIVRFVCDGIDAAYGWQAFGGDWTKGATVDHVGRYCYGGEIDQAPVARFQINDVEMFVYDAGIVAVRHVRDHGGVKIARLD